MRLRRLGHSCFLVTGPRGGRLLFDPYRSGAYDGAIAHGPVRERVDAVLLSHEQHEDHAGAALLPGAPLVIKAPGETSAREFRIVSRRSDHDAVRGRRFGRNLVHTVEAGGARLAHLGDLGCTNPAAPAPAPANLDCLLVPCGGTFTLGPREAAALVRRLRPRIAVPMHYRCARVALPLSPVEEFLAEFDERQCGRAGTEIEIGCGPRCAPPEPTRVLVMEAAL